MKSRIRTVAAVMVILLTISCETFSREGAEQREKRSGFHLGVSSMNLQDKVLNNAIHKGPGLSGGIFLEQSGKKSVMWLDLELGSDFLKSTFETEASSYWFSGSAGFSYLRRVSHKDPGFDLNLGGKIKTGTAIEYFDNWDESHFYWMTSYSIGAGFRLDYSSGGGSKIRVEGDLPLFSLVSRPPGEILYTQSSPGLSDVLKDLNHDLGLMSPAGYRELNLRVKYFPRNPGKFVPSIFWGLHYLNIHKKGSGPLKCINQTFGVEFIF